MTDLDVSSIIGLKENMSFEEYKNAYGLNSSAAKILDKQTPLHFMHNQMNPTIQTENMKLGTAFHAIMENEDAFFQSYKKIPKVDKRTKEGKAAIEKAISDADGCITLDEESYDSVLRMRDSVLNNEYAVNLIYQQKTEVSGFWQDEQTGVLCKFRADVIGDDYIVDFKSARSVSRWHKVCGDFGYDFQAAWYLMGMSAITGNEWKNFVHIAVENTAPYACIIRQFSHTWIDIATPRVMRALEIYKKCYESKIWPGPPKEIETMEPMSYQFANTDY